MVRVKQLAHIVLKVRNLEKSKQWYMEVLGLKLMSEVPGRIAFLSAGENVSHELGLLQVGASAQGPDARRVGLYHTGWQVESLEEMTNLPSRLQEMGVRVTGVADHGVSIGVYVMDPDGNELELFYELPPEEWPKGRDLFSGNFPRPVDVY